MFKLEHLVRDAQVYLTRWLMPILLLHPVPSPNLHSTTTAPQHLQSNDFMPAFTAENLSGAFSGESVAAPSPLSVCLTPNLLTEDVNKISARKISLMIPLTYSVIPPRPPIKEIQYQRQMQRPAPDPKTDYYHFRKWVMRKSGFSINDVKEVFRLYDWQKMELEQEPGVLDKIEELLRLKNAPWTSPDDRAFSLGNKTHALLNDIMRRHGWKRLMCYREEDTGKSRQCFRAVNSEMPNFEVLPCWLPDHLNLEDPVSEQVSQLLKLFMKQKDEKIHSGLCWKAEDFKMPIGELVRTNVDSASRVRCQQ
jgi:hypothetical protein